MSKRKNKSIKLTDTVSVDLADQRRAEWIKGMSVETREKDTQLKRIFQELCLAMTPEDVSLCTRTGPFQVQALGYDWMLTTGVNEAGHTTYTFRCLVDGIVGYECSAIQVRPDWFEFHMQSCVVGEEIIFANERVPSLIQAMRQVFPGVTAAFNRWQAEDDQRHLDTSN